MDHISEALEACRAGFPFAMFTVVPVLLLIVSPIAVDAAHDFKVYRMQQYDIMGNTFGKLFFSQRMQFCYGSK